MKVNKKTIVIILGLLMSSALFSQSVEFLEQNTVTSEGLYFWYPDGKKAFDYAPNISPRGDCFTVANGYIFFGWYKGGMDKRNLMISRKKIGSGNWVHVQLPHTNTLVDERFNPTPYPNGLGNSHQTISVGVSEKDNTIHIFFDHHNDPLNYIVSKKQKAFVPDNQFNANIFESRRRYLAPGENIRVTYPELTENALGDLVLNYRFGNSHAGEEVVHSYDGSWTRSKVISSGRPPKVPESKSNYAYGSPVFGNGEFYYAFSVRWDANRSALNEGVYLAKCGPDFTGQWKDLNGRNHQLPVTNFAPFLVDDPDTENDGGSSGSVGIAVSDAGDVHLSYKGRGRNTDYYYSYVRKAGENSFTRHRGVAKTGVAWGDRIYDVNVGRNGIITIESTKAGTFNYRQDLRFDANKIFGNSEYRISDGKIVVIVEDRSNSSTDKQKIYSYVFNINGGGSTGNQAPVVSITSPANNATFEVGQEIALKASASDPDGNLDKVNFKINDDFYKTVSTRPFEYTFTPTEPGTYKIAALAIDKENKRTETFVTITVVEKNDAPVASFVAPDFSSLEEGYSELYIKVDASDPDGDDISVMLKIDGAELRLETVAPFEWGKAGTLNSSETLGLTIGEHTLEAIVTDAKGLSTTISKTITITERNEAPIASFIAPTVSTLEEGYTELYVNVDATDPDGDDISVMLKIDGAELRLETVAPFEWGKAGTPNSAETIGLAIGDHVLEAIVTDAKGLSTTISKTITVDRITSTFSIEDRDELTVFPNPSNSGVFHFVDGLEWEIFKLDGKFVLSGSGEMIDISNKQKGVYFLKAQDKVYKLIVH